MNNSINNLAVKRHPVIMKGTVYIVYIHEPRTTPFQFGTCYALAFVEDENPDGFALIDQHLSSNYGWAGRIFGEIPT